VLHVYFAGDVRLHDVEGAYEDRGHGVVLHSPLRPRPGYCFVVNIEDNFLVLKFFVQGDDGEEEPYHFIDSRVVLHRPGELRLPEDALSEPGFAVGGP